MAFASIGIAITQLYVLSYPLFFTSDLPTLFSMRWTGANIWTNSFRLNTASLEAGGGDPYTPLRQMGKPLGATFLGISIVMLGVGFHRYFEGQHWIIRGKFPASRGSIVLVVAVTFALMLTSLVVVIVVGPTTFER